MAIAVLDKHAVGKMRDGFFDAYTRHDIQPHQRPPQRDSVYL